MWREWVRRYLIVDLSSPDLNTATRRLVFRPTNWVLIKWGPGKYRAFERWCDNHMTLGY